MTRGPAFRRRRRTSVRVLGRPTPDASLPRPCVTGEQPRVVERFSSEPGGSDQGTLCGVTGDVLYATVTPSHTDWEVPEGELKTTNRRLCSGKPGGLRGLRVLLHRFRSMDCEVKRRVEVGNEGSRVGTEDYIWKDVEQCVILLE